LKSAARPFCEALKLRGVLCKETHASVIRLAPPLIIDKADLIWGLEQIREVLEDDSIPSHDPTLAEVAASHGI
jgi:ornithine--oxo-acid transaminase